MLKNKLSLEQSEKGLYPLFMRIILCSWLVCTCIVPFYPVRSDIGKNAYASVPLQGDGVWMHVDTFMDQPDQVLEEYAEALVRANIEIVFILGKKIDGSVNFPSEHALKRSFSDDPMKRLVSILKSRQRKVFFYFPVNTDPAWNAKNPDDIAWQFGNKQQKIPLQDPEKKLVNLTSSTYNNYILRLVLDAATMYPLDGIQLDYIRYRNAHFGFSPTENQMAIERGININKIKDLAYSTFVQPGDWRTLLKYYDEQDKDVELWVKLREDIVFNFANLISHEVRKRKCQFSVTLVSSGANGSAYGAVHFSQSYQRLSSIADIAVPMAYHGSQADPADYVRNVIMGSRERLSPSCRVLIGLQAYETSTAKMNQAIAEARKHQMNIVLFRVGTFAIAHLDIFHDNNQALKLRVDIFQSIPRQAVLGIEIRGLSSCIQLPSDEWNMDQCFFEDGFKIWGKNFTHDVGHFWMELRLEERYGLVSGIIKPYVVLADAKVDMPTYTSFAFHIEHSIIRPQLQSLENYHGVFPLSLMVNEGTSYVQADQLSYWNCTVEKYPQEQRILVKNDFRKLDFSFKNNKLELSYLPSKEPMRLNKNPLLIQYPWIPLRTFLQYLGYTVVYNASTKEIHALKALKNPKIVKAEKLLSTNDFYWFWLAQDTLRINAEDLLSHNFYELIRLAHERGYRFSIVFNPSSKLFPHGTKVYWMMKERVPSWYQVDLWEWNAESTS